MTSSNVIQRRSQDSNVAARNLTGSLAFRIIITALFVVVAFALTGCSASFDPKLSGGANSSGTAATFTGRVHGGQQPVAGAEVFVFQVGESGYPGQSGVASNVSIISSNTVGSFNGVLDGNNLGPAVLTDSNGNFAFTLSSCTTGDGVYIATLGGQAITGQTNAAESSMAPIGICPATGVTGLLQNTPFVNVNEVSTVAFAYAMAGFTSPGLSPGFAYISTSPTNIAGMQNAFMLAQQLFSVSTAGGANSGSASMVGATFPAAKINTMANILADCVNSAGVTGSSSPCYTLFQNATSNGTAGSGTVPSDTASAMINITHNVVSNVSTLYGLANNTYAPFTPTLTGTPTDFAMAIKYTAPNMYDPYQLAIDSTGSVYALNLLNSSGATTPSITKFVPGKGFLGTSTLSSVASIAIDQSNNIFLLNNLASSSLPTISEYASSNTAALGSAAANPPSLPSGVAAIPQLYIFQPNILVGPTNNVEVNDVGAIYNVPYSSGSGYGTATKISGNNGNVIYSFAENGLGTTYFISEGSGIVYSVTSSGTTTDIVQNIYTFEVGLDPESRLWQIGYDPSDNNEGVLGIINSAFNGFVPAANGNDPFVSGNLSTNGAQPIFDGLGTGWLADNATTVCAIQNVTSSGMTTNTAVLSYPGVGIIADGTGAGTCNGDAAQTAGDAIDQSGNLWLGIRTPTSRTVSGYVLELLGIAAPTIQPLSLQSVKILPSNNSFDIRP